MKNENYDLRIRLGRNEKVATYVAEKVKGNEKEKHLCVYVNLKVKKKK